MVWWRSKCVFDQFREPPPHRFTFTHCPMIKSPPISIATTKNCETLNISAAVVESPYLFRTSLPWYNSLFIMELGCQASVEIEALDSLWCAWFSDVHTHLLRYFKNRSPDEYLSHPVDYNTVGSLLDEHNEPLLGCGKISFSSNQKQPTASQRKGDCHPVQ